MGEISNRSVAEIERAIDQARNDLVYTVEQLQLAVRERLDWRQQVRRRPLPILAGAFVVGLYLGTR